MDRIIRKMQQLCARTWPSIHTRFPTMYSGSVTSSDGSDHNFVRSSISLASVHGRLKISVAMAPRVLVGGSRSGGLAGSSGSMTDSRVTASIGPGMVASPNGLSKGSGVCVLWSTMLLVASLADIPSTSSSCTALALFDPTLSS